MADKVRLPDGDVVPISELEEGLECRRCDAFIPMEAAEEEPKPEVQRYQLEAKGFATTVNSGRYHTSRGGPDDITAILCPGCMQGIEAFLDGGRIPKLPEEATDGDE